MILQAELHEIILLIRKKVDGVFLRADHCLQMAGTVVDIAPESVYGKLSVGLDRQALFNHYLLMLLDRKLMALSARKSNGNLPKLPAFYTLDPDRVDAQLLFRELKWLRPSQMHSNFLPDFSALQHELSGQQQRVVKHLYTGAWSEAAMTDSGKDRERATVPDVYHYLYFLCTQMEAVINQVPFQTKE